MLGWISLLTDTASEAIYPLLPLFLTHTLGARVLALGVVEGVAEATATGVKVASGYLSDRLQRRRVLVRLGYGLSSLVRPLMGVATGWGDVLAVRFTDRVGKGIRSAPRDAMLAAASPPSMRGRVFGVHRAMDHAGAIVGPVAAALFLWRHPGAFGALFLATAVPSVLVLVLLARLPPDVPASRVPGTHEVPQRGDVGQRSTMPRAFYRILAVLFLFTLGNSSDAFLLLRLSALGVAAPVIPLLWAALHVVKASTSVGGGLLSDRWGRAAAIGAGWLVYAAVYAGFAMVETPAAVVGLFLAYGIYFGLTEGAEKALVADLAPPAARGAAFGWYYAVSGIGTLVASLLFALVWEQVGPVAAFGVGAVLALAALGLLPWALRTRPA